MLSMTTIKPVSMILVLAVQVFVHNYYTKFHENPTICSVANTRSQMNIRTCFPIDIFFSRKERLQESRIVPANTNKPQGRSAENIKQLILYVEMNAVYSITLLCIRKTTKAGHLPPAVLFATRPTCGPSLLYS
jgi:hypothetical protein